MYTHNLTPYVLYYPVVFWNWNLLYGSGTV